MLRLAYSVVLMLVLVGCGKNDESTPDDIATDQFEEAGGDPTQATLISYFLVFASDEAALGAASDLERHGFKMNAEYTASFAEEGEGWLVVEKVGPLADVEKAEALLSDVAAQHDGQYDGWEAAP